MDVDHLAATARAEHEARPLDPAVAGRVALAARHVVELDRPHLEARQRGGVLVSIVGMPEPQTARKDLRRGPGLAALFWLVSLGTRLRARRHGVRYRYLFMRPSAADLAELARWIDTGELEVVLDRTFPFDQVADAFAYLETGRAKGKVVVTLA